MSDGRIEKGKATRERLIAAGRDLFGAHGYEATSIGAVLEHAGVARGALYHHFDSKEALFDAVLDHVVGDIARQTAGRAGPGASPVDQLRAGCHAWLEMVLDPALQRITILDPPAVVGWTRLREIDELHTLGAVRAALHAAAPGAGLRAADVDVLAHMVLAAVNEAALLIARADDPRKALRAGTAAIDVLLDRLTTQR